MLRWGGEDEGKGDDFGHCGKRKDLGDLPPMVLIDGRAASPPRCRFNKRNEKRMKGENQFLGRMGIGNVNWLGIGLVLGFAVVSIV